MESSNRAVSGKTVVYGLIGDPVQHSMSPAIQNTAFRSAGIDAVYVPFHVRAQELKRGIQGLRALGVRGFNVTAPHKVRVLQYIDKVSNSAGAIGSVNTVINQYGKLLGYNTDGPGALGALEEAGAVLDDKSVLLFGAGGAGRAIAYALAQRANSIRVVNRTATKAKQLAAQLRRKAKADIEFAALSSKAVRDFVEQADILVNASSMGMDGRDNIPIKSQWLRPDHCVFDIVYKPPQTRLLELAHSAGSKCITGLDMLVNQGACSFELWTGRKAPVLEMRHVIAQKLLAMEHAESS